LSPFLQEQAQEALGFVKSVTSATLMDDYPADSTSTIQQADNLVDADVVRYQARTGASTITLNCPTGGSSYSIYVTSALLQQLGPDGSCDADYTPWFRFPCSGASPCTINWAP
jgi:hypothetical protein